MGNSPQPTNLRNSISTEAQNEFSGINIYEEQYYEAYEKVKDYPHFFTQFLHESPKFGKNLQYLFPGGLDGPQQYFQMVMYLRKYDPIIKSSQQAQQNCIESTLLDRFFMICMGNMSFEKYKRAKLSKYQIQDLLLDYYMLFVSDPKPSSLSKVLTHIEIQDICDTNGLIQVIKFAAKLREYFPHVHKYLRDYYMAKFHDGQKDFRVLKFFNSKILADDAVLLALRIPELQKPSIVQLYNSDDCGTSFFTLTRKLIGYTGPWLLLVKHSQRNMQDKKQTYVFGTYQSGPVRDIYGYQGDLNGFMFTIEPHIKFMTTGNGQGGQNYFFIFNGYQLLTKHRKGIGFGGNRQKLNNFKLWLDENLDKSKVYNGYDMTYGYGPLAGQLTENLKIQRVQIWGLGTQQNLRDQQKYWAQRDAQKTRVRKVNKRQLFQESQLFLQNIFAYQDQVADVQEIKKRRSPIKKSPGKRSPLKPRKGKENKENELILIGKESNLPR